MLFRIPYNLPRHLPWHSWQEWDEVRRLLHLVSLVYSCIFFAATLLPSRFSLGTTLQVYSWIFAADPLRQANAVERVCGFPFFVVSGCRTSLPVLLLICFPVLSL